MTRILRAFVLACLLLALSASSAGAWGNGQLPSSQLASIGEKGSCAKLRKDAAAAWNTMQLRAGQKMTVSGCASAYRKVGHPSDYPHRYGTQWYFRVEWCNRGACGNAAPPGTSNHGLGLAADVPWNVRTLIDRHGRALGWAKDWSDAPHEWWHLRYRDGVWKERPNPGPSLRYPILRKGSGGVGQAGAVRELQRRLRVHGARSSKPTGDFYRQTRKQVRRFQRKHHLGADGVVGEKTWRALRRDPKKKGTR